jgi:hypothetical protein
MNPLTHEIRTTWAAMQRMIRDAEKAAATAGLDFYGIKVVADDLLPPGVLAEFRDRDGNVLQRIVADQPPSEPEVQK